MLNKNQFFNYQLVPLNNLNIEVAGENHQIHIRARSVSEVTSLLIVSNTF